MAGRKFTVFALFYVVFEGNFQVQALPLPPTPWGGGGGGLYLEGRFNGGFFALQVWGALNVDALSFGILWCSRTLGGR